MSDAPPINPSPTKSSSPVDGSVAEEPAVAVSIELRRFPTFPRARLAEKDEPPPALAKLSSVSFARTAAGKHNSISLQSNPIHLSLILSPFLRVLVAMLLWQRWHKITVRADAQGAEAGQTWQKTLASAKAVVPIPH